MDLEGSAGIAEDIEMADPEGHILEKPHTKSCWDMKPVVPGVAVTPYRPGPPYAAKPDSLRLETDMTVPDPLLTQHSGNSWIGTMLTLISRTLGPEQWKAYKNEATTLLEMRSKPRGMDTYAYSDMINLISNHAIVGYLHNDLARELNGRHADVFPLIEGLQPAGGLHIKANEQAAIIKRIAQKWDRDFSLENRMPRSRCRQDSTMANLPDAVFQRDRALQECRQVLHSWDDKSLADMDTLVAAMKDTSV